MRAPVAAAVLFAALAGPASAQQNQCRTAPVGTSTQYCASEAFVTQTAALALTSATLQAAPANPAGTTSGVGVMMGLGTVCKITPVFSGRVRFDLIGNIFNSNAGAGTAMRMYFGTGSAPANGAATTGSNIGAAQSQTAPAASAVSPIANAAIVTGLSPGTAYWFDANVLVGGGTGSISGMACTAMEF